MARILDIKKEAHFKFIRSRHISPSSSTAPVLLLLSPPSGGGGVRFIVYLDRSEVVVRRDVLINISNIINVTQQLKMGGSMLAITQIQGRAPSCRLGIGGNWPHPSPQ